MIRTYTIRAYAVHHRSDARRRLIIRAATMPKPRIIFMPSGMAAAAITGCGESTPPGWIMGKELLDATPEGRHIVALVAKAIEAESAYEGAYHNAARTRNWSTLASVRGARVGRIRAALTELAAKYPHQPEPHRYSQTGFAAEAEASQ